MAKVQKKVEKRNDTGKDNIRFCARSARTSHKFLRIRWSGVRISLGAPPTKQRVRAFVHNFECSPLND